MVWLEIGEAAEVTTITISVKVIVETKVKVDSIVEAVVVARPLPSLAHLVPALFDRDNTLNTKFLVLDCLVGAGATLSDSSHPDFGRFVGLAVGGLSAGGGGAWGGGAGS